MATPGRMAAAEEHMFTKGKDMSFLDQVKANKNFMIVAGACFVVGIILTTIGFALGDGLAWMQWVGIVALVLTGLFVAFYVFIGSWKENVLEASKKITFD